ncbi:PLP-dependent aminotransferase family protein [Nocardioides sp. Arc9.136]|uniref:MocR-like pyridoxine biosynthesis transcription factor PdxR n=1 Tax=Nocardioides sp. Arc9.136 TaxID=2996826 RepID=UPI0026667A59|nr:PLP-dependent aminotransferase family protein [Nocardioides sp. Arc9.136]WKN49783.1 PLP-dependent aminotransferase family protein [Nocardioides sp. Arc9.136]
MARTLAVVLDRADHRTLGAQLADEVRRQVGDGRLPVGTRLPSTRALAADLGVARAVAERAYAQLVAEGWLEGRHGAGTFVAGGTGLAPPPRRRPAPASAGSPLVRLGTGTPWIDPRYADAWRRAWRDVGAARPPEGYDDPRGLPALRVELAARLARTRGLDVEPDDVRITTGTGDGLRHVLAALPPGAVGVEDPGYRSAAAVAELLGRTVVDLPAADPAGWDLTGLAAAYVTPAHQHPLGHTMPGQARVALLAAARDAGALVVEDDYDSEFRYDVAPVPALASLDRERVAYLGTASKTVAPSMRLGWLVAPPAVLDRVDRTREVTHDAAAWPVQRAFLSLLREGYVERVVRSARRRYAQRAELVATALEPYGDLAGPVAGMYATLRLDEADALRAHAAARAAGFDVPLLADHCRSAGLHGLVVGFGGCTDQQLAQALRALTTALA